MRIKMYEILRRAGESGITIGYNRSHKHTNKPTEETMKEEIYHGIMGELHEVLDFEDEISDPVNWDTPKWSITNND